MELRSTGNQNTSNTVTMSVLEYLAKKGRETMNVNGKTLQSEHDNYKKKHKVKSAEIVVRKITEKPYYEIKYFDLSYNEYHIGYGSYKLEYVFEWLEQCFEIVEKNTNADKIRNMTDDELATMLCNTCTYNEGEDPMFSIWVDREISMYHSYGDILDWLKQPAEE